jgi:hypothetical protein
MPGWFDGCKAGCKGDGGYDDTTPQPSRRASISKDDVSVLRAQLEEESLKDEANWLKAVEEHSAPAAADAAPGNWLSR